MNNLSSLKNIKVDDRISCSYHNSKYNKEIFNILNFEGWDFYHYTNVKKPKTINDVINYFSDEKSFFDIFYNNKVVGMIEFNPKNKYFSYWIATKFQNLGITSKTLKILSDKILNLGFDEVCAHIVKDNVSSVRVAKKSGFVLKEERVYDEDDIMLLFCKSKA